MDLDPDTNPILHNFAVSFSHFYSCFCRINGNYKEAYIFDNNAFNLDGQTINPEFFGLLFYNRYKNAIRSLTFASCFVGRRLKTAQEFAASGLPFPPATWMRLQATLLHSRQILKKTDETDNLSVSITNFFAKLTKGSRQYRSIIYCGQGNRTAPENLRTVMQYSILTTIPVPDQPYLGKCLGLWNKSFLPNDVRNFLFLLRNNSLPLNNRLNAFNENVSPFCTFCRIIDGDTATRDSFNHFFFSCPVTNNLLLQWTRELNPAPDINSHDFKQLYWYGSGTLSNDESGTVALCMDLFKYVIWKSKLRRRLPNFICVLREFSFLVETSCTLSRKVKHRLQNNNLLANFLPARG